MKRVFLAGEGTNEIGSWGRHPSYRHTAETGALEALLKKSVETGWEICGGLFWKEIRKFRAGDHRSAETRNVLGAALRAREAGADALIFSRDRDRVPTRERDIEDGVGAASKEIGIGIAGGTAIEDLDAWVLACLGITNSEENRNAKQTLERERGIATTSAKVVAIEQVDLSALPADAGSLRQWIDRVRAVLGTGIEES
jgi:hypothetical protein